MVAIVNRSLIPARIEIKTIQLMQKLDGNLLQNFEKVLLL